jgi:hypothetical protein
MKRRPMRRRALRTADWLHNCAKNLEETLGWKSLDEYAREESPYIRSMLEPDGSEQMVSLKASDLYNLIVIMYQEAAELRRFSEPVKPKRRLSR